MHTTGRVWNDEKAVLFYEKAVLFWNRHPTCSEWVACSGLRLLASELRASLYAKLPSNPCILLGTRSIWQGSSNYCRPSSDPTWIWLEHKPDSLTVFQLFLCCLQPMKFGYVAKITWIEKTTDFVSLSCRCFLSLPGHPTELRKQVETSRYTCPIIKLYTGSTKKIILNCLYM